MARIPSASDIQTAIPSGRQSTARIDTSNAGLGLQTAANELQKFADRKSNYEVSKADADFLIAKSKLDTEADQDPEYGTVVDRYNATASQELGRISGGISNPRARASFVQRHKVGLARSLEQVTKKAHVKERDFERGEINDKLNALREVGLTGDMNAAVSQVKALLNNAAGADLYGHEEKSKVFEAWQQDATIGKLETMPPENRVEFLKSPLAKKLPSDVQARLRRSAEEGVLLNKSIAKVDKLLAPARDLDPTEIRAEIASIKDSKLRTAVERRYDYESAAQYKAEVREKSDIYDRYSDPIRSGNITVGQIKDNNLDEWLNMTPQQRESLRTMQANSAKSDRTLSDAQTRKTLDELHLRKEFVLAREFFIDADSKGKLNRTDSIAYNKVTIDGVMPIDVKSLKTTSQRMAAATTNFSPGDQSLFDARIGEWNEAFIERENKLPNDKDIDEAIDRMLFEFDTHRFLPFGKEKFFALEEEDKLGDPELFDDLVNWFSTQGEAPSRGDFVNKFNSIREQRNAAQ